MTDLVRTEPGLVATSLSSALMSTLIAWTALMFVSFDPDTGICFGGGTDQPACPAAPCHAVCGTTVLKPKKSPTA